MEARCGVTPEQIERVMELVVVYGIRSREMELMVRSNNFSVAREHRDAMKQILAEIEAALKGESTDG